MPDYATENRTLVALAQAFADAPISILQTLAEKILEALKAGSAGVSLLTDNEERFYWPAIAGMWQAHIGGGSPRNFGPSGDVLDCNAPLLLTHVERRYAYLEPVTPAIEECLLVPFHVAGKAVGTIWAIAHDNTRKFDSEDLRLLENLGRFASAAYQTQMMGAREQRHAALKVADALQTGHALEQHNAQLLASANTLQRSEAELRDFVENASVGLHWVGSDDREQQRDAVAAAIRSDDPVPYNEEYRVVHPDGTLRWVLATARANFIQEGPVRRLVSLDGTVADITDRKHDADALRESQRFLRSSLDALSGHIVILDESGVIMEVNEAWRRFADQNQFTGIDHGVGSNYFQHFGQTFPQTGNAQTCISGINNVINGRQTRFEMEYSCHSPTELRWFVMRVTRFESPGPVRIVIVHDNCTERKLAETTLRASEEFNRSIIESSPDCIKVLDLDGNLLSMLSGQALLGIEDIRPFLNKSWFDFWDTEYRPAAEVAVASAAAGGTGHFVGFFCTARGEPKWWDVVISPILGANGKPERILSVSRDVTKRKHAEMNLAFLAAVSHDLALWTNVDEMMTVVAAKMAAHFDLSICAFVEVDEAAEQVVVSHDWHREDVPGLVGVYRLADFVGEEFVRLARAGEAIIVGDTTKDERTNDVKFAALKIASFICMPLNRNGQWRFALCLFRSQPHLWREDEIELTRELIARIWTRLERLNAEEALRTSEEQYRKLFNSMDEGLCIIEMIFDEHDNPVDYRFLEVNATFEKQTGMSNATGNRVRELIPNIEPYWIELYGKVAKTGEAVRYVNVVKGLGERWLDVFAFRLEGPGSLKISVLFTDITERTKTEKALRQSEQRFRALFDRGPIAMYSCDVSGETKEYNRVAVALWGVEPDPDETDEQFRSGFKMYLPDGTFLPYAETPMTQVLCGKIAVVHDKQVVVERPDGTRMTIVANIVPLKNEREEIIGAINCFYDITERSLLEKKSLEQAESLADLSRRKDEFLAMLSHELRNPLAPISNAMHLLRLQKNEGPVQRQARGIIERQVGQLTHLIDDLMEVSRFTSGRIHLHEERLALSGIIEHAVETVGPLIDQHRHSLELTLPAEPIWLQGDASRLEQVIVNLLTNAAKYTDEGGTISLSISQEGDDAVIRVKDTGVGIAPDLLPRIFELFTQADRSLDRAQGGLGIGLCLVQRLVEMHRGTVTAASTIGIGSEFVVRLPVVQHAAPLIEPSTEKPILFGESLRILVVEDNVDAAETLTILLETSGHKVRTANDGLAALQAALEYRPHVVLLDIGLPGMDGFSVARQLREQPTLANIVLVAMTGYGEVVARQKSSEAGFNHHLVKPADFRKLQEILAGVTDAAVLTR